MDPENFPKFPGPLPGKSSLVRMLISAATDSIFEEAQRLRLHSATSCRWVWSSLRATVQASSLHLAIRINFPRREIQTPIPGPCLKVLASGDFLFAQARVSLISVFLSADDDNTLCT